jgi:hypothetical protein
VVGFLCDRIKEWTRRDSKSRPLPCESHHYVVARIVWSGKTFYFQAFMSVRHSSVL